MNPELPKDQTSAAKKTASQKTAVKIKAKAGKFNARTDASRLEAIANNMSYNDPAQATAKHTLNEIAMRLATGGYSTK